MNEKQQNVVRVTVSGLTGTGKTWVAACINNMFLNRGLNVECHAPDLCNEVTDDGDVIPKTDLPKIEIIEEDISFPQRAPRIPPPDVITKTESPFFPSGPFAIQLLARDFDRAFPDARRVPGVLYDPTKRCAYINNESMRREFRTPDGSGYTVNIGEWITCLEDGTLCPALTLEHFGIAPQFQRDYETRAQLSAVANAQRELLHQAKESEAKRGAEFQAHSDKLSKELYDAKKLASTQAQTICDLRQRLSKQYELFREALMKAPGTTSQMPAPTLEPVAVTVNINLHGGVAEINVVPTESDK